MAKRKEFDLEEIKDLYLSEGYSIPDIAKLKNCSKETIRNFLCKNNIVKDKEQVKAEVANKMKQVWVSELLRH